MIHLREGESYKMITTVTLNAAIDKTYYLPRFELSKVSRVQKMYALPGGKGINVARVLNQLGENTLVTGYVAGKNGEFIENELDKQGISHDFVKVDGESRLCLNIIDESNNSSTELLEQGPVIDVQKVEEMRQRIRQLSQRSKIVVFSGSIPLGVPTNMYKDLIAIAKSEGAKVFLDTSGDALLAGIQAKPFLIKPNEDEVQKILGRKLEKKEDLYESMIEWMNQGISSVVVSLGVEGSIAGFQGELYRVKTPTIQAVNTVGCGDSFVAGMAAAMVKGENILDSLRLATAAGAANALTQEAGNLRLEDLQRLLQQVEIFQIR